MSVESSLEVWRVAQQKVWYWSWHRNGHDWDQSWVGATYWRFDTFLLDLEVCVHEDEHPVIWMIGNDASGVGGEVYYEWPQEELEARLAPHCDLNCLDFALALAMFRDECLALVPQMREEVLRRERA